MPKARSKRRAVATDKRFSWERKHDQALREYLNGKLEVDRDKFSGVVDQGMEKKASWATAAAYLNSHPDFSGFKDLEGKHVRDRWTGLPH